MARLTLPQACRRRVVLLLAALLWLSCACSYDDREPGLFGRPDPAATASTPPRLSGRTTSTNPDLPVVGEAVWASAEGQHIQVRIAVHAVRRIAGATVLDWSLTPLRAPGLRPGDPLPTGLLLGLTRPEEDTVRVLLVDSAAHRVYRPLTATADADRPYCLCSPLTALRGTLALGRTRLLQAAFPALPADVSTIDVDIPTVPIFWHIPVTDVGLVPSAASATDLAAPGNLPLPGPATPVFRYAGGQQFFLSVDDVVAASTFTSVRWTVHSVTAGAGLDSASTPPFAERHSDQRRIGNVTASGPLVMPSGASGQPLSVRLMSARRVGASAVECLCTNLEVWTASLREADQEAGVVTNLAAVPIGTQRVDVRFPGLPPLRDVAVRSASDGAFRSAAALSRRTGVWTYDPERPPDGWSVDRWPTPLPERHQLKRYQATVETLLR